HRTLPSFPTRRSSDLAAGTTYDSGDYQASLERLIELADYPGLRRAQTAGRQEGRLQGIGISTYVEEAAGFAEDRATARLELDGTDRKSTRLNSSHVKI